MGYKILKKVSSSTTDYYQFVVDSNDNIVESDNLDIIEARLKELSVSTPVSYLKVISEIKFDNDFVFDGIDEPSKYTYEINYYFDEVKDEIKSITGEAVLGTEILLLDYSSAIYEIDTSKTEVFPIRLTVGLDNNIIGIYYKTI